MVGDFGVVSSRLIPRGKEALFTVGPFLIVDMPRAVLGEDLTQQGFCFFADTIKLGQDFTVVKREGRRIILDLDKPDAVLYKVFINDQPVKTFMWAPYSVDITDFVKTGSNRISTEPFSGNRNLLGPHHHTDEELYSVCPSSFTHQLDGLTGRVG